ncbi:hypothetical protein SBDP1_760046 [Syntrophobacter sp. SbD1]|nr:hypothetical protein SBDP1_760046 [Syntrophobacter sp. SbD1]
MQQSRQCGLSPSIYLRLKPVGPTVSAYLRLKPVGPTVSAAGETGINERIKNL